MIKVFLIILIYALIGIIICEKCGLTEATNEDSVIDMLIYGLFITFWPFIIAIHFLLTE